MKMKTIMLDGLNRSKADIFFSKYDLKFVFDTNINKKSYLGRKSDKICRFCGRAKPNTSFKKDAHVIPQLLGNRKLLSYFECDKCNELFSIFENSLASYLDPFRTFVKMQGKKGTNIPKFKEPRSKMVIKSSDKKDIDIEIIDSLENVEINESKRSIIVRGKRNPFTPLYIYKVFVKIGLCLVDDIQIANYDTAIRFLRVIKSRTKVKLQSAKLFFYFIPGPPLLEKPFVQLWERKATNENTNILKHTLVIYLPNLVFQIFLPFYSSDFKNQSKGVKYNMPPIPLLYDQDSLIKKFNYYSFDIDNLMSTKVLKNSSFEIRLQSDLAPFTIN